MRGAGSALPIGSVAPPTLLPTAPARDPQALHSRLAQGPNHAPNRPAVVIQQAAQRTARLEFTIRRQRFTGGLQSQA